MKLTDFSITEVTEAAKRLFVRTELLRREVPKKGDALIPCMIPVSVVSGAFDLTEQEEEEYGFKGGKRKG